MDKSAFKPLTEVGNKSSEEEETPSSCREEALRDSDMAKMEPEMTNPWTISGYISAILNATIPP